jgi:DNA mismatch repair protein MutS2
LRYPFPLQLFPDTAAGLLGFDAVRARLVQHATGPEAAETLAALHPFGSADAARAEMARTADLADALRFDDPVPFAHADDLRPVLRRIAPEGGRAAAEDLLALRRTLETVRLLGAYLGARRTKYAALAALADALVAQPALERRLAATVDDEGRVRDDASAELSRLRRTLARARQGLRDAVLTALKSAQAAGIAAADEPTIRAGRLVIALKAEARRKVPGFVHDVSATGQTVFLEPASALDLGNDVRELELAEVREVERVLLAASDEARQALPALRDAARALVAFDVLRAKARLALDLDAVLVTVGTEGVLDLRQARHAALVLRFREEGRTVVPLTLRLDGEARTLVITGPNAGGKSVALKTAGLCALMAGCGLLVPAAPETRVDFFSALLVDIGDAQSLEDDLSTFTSHVARLRHILREAGPGALVLLDEAGTGTDPAEGGALAQAVLETLTAADARTVATTHIGALKAFAHAHPHARNGAMRFDRETLAPTYVFDAGVPGSSFAFEVAARGGLAAPVIERARALVGAQGTALEDLILSFQDRTRALDAALRDAETARKEAEAARADFAERRDTIRRQRDTLRAEALAEAERIVREANAAVERTIREIREAEAAPEATRAAREALAEVRETVERQREKTERRARPKPPPSAPRERIAVGDQVVLDGGTSVLEVLAIEGKEAVLAAGPIRLRAAFPRLLKVGGPQRQRIEVRQVSAAPQGLAALGASTRLDVRGHRPTEALAELPRFIDAAVAAGAERVEVLHGKGTGALRIAIRDWLDEQPEVLGAEDALPEQGGAGVTVVTLR